MNHSKRILVLLAAVIGIAVTAFLLQKPRLNKGNTTKQVEVLTQLEGEAGKVGDVQVTEEALQLAKITIQPADQRLVKEKIEVSGSVRAGGDQLVKVTPRASGKVIKFFAQVGDSVRAGQSLALVESNELAQAQSRYRQAVAKASAARQTLQRQKQLAGLGQFGKPALEEARNRVAASESAVNSAERSVSEEKGHLAEAKSEREAIKSKVAVVQAELEVMKAKLDRADALFKEELISKQDFERIRADHKKADAEFDAAKSALDQGDIRITTARSNLISAESEYRLAKQKEGIARQALQREERVYSGRFSINREVIEAETQLRQAQVEVNGASDGVRLLGGTPGGGNTFLLTTPIFGKVQDRTVTLGETIDPEHAAFTVVNLDKVWAELAINPRDLADVQVGDVVELYSETTSSQKFFGTILTIGSMANENNRTVSVRTTLGNKGHLLKPGSFVKGSLTTDVRQQRTTVPTKAIQEHTGRPTIYVALSKTGAFEVRHVTLGIEGDGWREIKEGLKPGERVAATGTFYLKSEALKSSLSDGCCSPGG